MAYLHCHTQDCGWSQDDFWTFRPRFIRYKYKNSRWKLGFTIGYNPISKIWNDIVWLWKPRWISLDDWLIEDLRKFTNVNVKVKRVKVKIDQAKFMLKNEDRPDVYEIERLQVHSWDWLRLEFVKEWKIFRGQKWWTWKDWKKHKDSAVCPKCGLRNFDID